MKKKKLGRPVKLNPIAEKLNEMTDNSGLSKEMICVQINVCYPTFNNIFTRNRVSKMQLLALQMSNIIDKEDIREYNVWLEKQKNIKPKPRKPACSNETDA